MDIKRIQEFKGKYKGQRCFVVATGPSLTVEDLNTLHKNNEVVFSMNTIVKAFEKTEFGNLFPNVPITLIQNFNMLTPNETKKHLNISSKMKLYFP